MVKGRFPVKKVPSSLRRCPASCPRVNEKERLKDKTDSKSERMYSSWLELSSIDGKEP
jgi:hypothetical protein